MASFNLLERSQKKCVVDALDTSEPKLLLPYGIHSHNKEFFWVIHEYNTHLPFHPISQISAQISQTLKFHNGQYMGNCRKHLFWPTKFPSIYCILCGKDIHNVDTWPHLLAACKHLVIKGLQLDRHNKALFRIKEMLFTHHLTR